MSKWIIPGAVAIGIACCDLTFLVVGLLQILLSVGVALLGAAAVLEGVALIGKRLDRVF